MPEDFCANYLNSEQYGCNIYLHWLPLIYALILYVLSASFPSCSQDWNHPVQLIAILLHSSKCVDWTYKYFGSLRSLKDLVEFSVLFEL